jgi:hypothetical protein
MVVTKTKSIFLDVTPCSPVVYLLFVGRYCFHLQGRKVNRESNT